MNSYHKETNLQYKGNPNISHLIPRDCLRINQNTDFQVQELEKQFPFKKATVAFTLLGTELMDSYLDWSKRHITYIP